MASIPPCSKSFLAAASRVLPDKCAYRATYRSELLGTEIDDRVKWWGPGRHIVTYKVNPRRDELYFIASTPEPDFKIESWSARGDLEQMRAAFTGFHPQARVILDACPEVRKWALVERDPLVRWSEGRVVLIGDACHPMLPYMAQGGSAAIEDAVVLARCLEGTDLDGFSDAFRRFERNRKDRTSRISAWRPEKYLDAHGTGYDLALRLRCLDRAALLTGRAMRAVEVGDEITGYAVKTDCVSRTSDKMRMYTDEQCRSICSTSPGHKLSRKSRTCSIPWFEVDRFYGGGDRGALLIDCGREFIWAPDIDHGACGRQPRSD